MRPSLQALMKKIKNKTVFIIGGGPSAKNVDFDLLQDEVVVCVNDAYRFFPNATVIYWVDESWVAENYDEVMSHKCDMVFTSKPAQHITYDKINDPKTSANTYILKRTGDAGYDPNYDCVMGNNSGVQVLNLVANMKPSKVVLIGYDMRRANDGATHFHTQYRPPIGDYIYDDLFLPSITSFEKQRKNHGNTVPIINANPDSAVRCFPFGNYKDHITK